MLTFRPSITYFSAFRLVAIVTATAHVKNFRSKNSFKSDVALKHAPDERPVKKADQKSEIAPAREDKKRRRKKQSLEHGEVPIFGLWRLHYIGNRNRCSRCSPEDPAASCAVTSASAGKPWSIRSC